MRNDIAANIRQSRLFSKTHETMLMENEEQQIGESDDEHGAQQIGESDDEHGAQQIGESDDEHGAQQIGESDDEHEEDNMQDGKAASQSYQTKNRLIGYLSSEEE